MVTLVTGAAGFLGQYLMPHLKNLNPNEKIHGCALELPKQPQATFEILDLTDSKKVFELIKNLKPRRVYHLAGIAKVSSDICFESYFHQNTLTTHYLLEALANLNQPVDFFLASSVHVYGNQNSIITERTETKPEGPYGFTKYLAEETLKSFTLRHPKIRGVVGRLYSCIGPNQPLGFVVSDICKKIKELKKSRQLTLEVGPTETHRGFSDVRDVIKTFPILLNSELDSRFEIFNIAPSKETQVGRMIQILLQLEGIEAKILSKQSKSNSFKGLKIDSSKMKQYVPETIFRPLESTLKDILDSTLC